MGTRSLNAVRGIALDSGPEQWSPGRQERPCVPWSRCLTTVLPAALGSGMRCEPTVPRLCSFSKGPSGQQMQPANSFPSPHPDGMRVWEGSAPARRAVSNMGTVQPEVSCAQAALHAHPCICGCSCGESLGRSSLGTIRGDAPLIMPLPGGCLLLASSPSLRGCRWSRVSQVPSPEQSKWSGPANSEDCVVTQAARASGGLPVDKHCAVLNPEHSSLVFCAVL